ncbi:MAG: hypothetical protein KC545_09665, partial [Nitrospira sp.]|nr:hypothetical protein [Nitrospira sp.]
APQSQKMGIEVIWVHLFRYFMPIVSLEQIWICLLWSCLLYSCHGLQKIWRSCGQITGVFGEEAT